MTINQQPMQELNEKLIDIWTKGKKEYINQVFSKNINYVLNGVRINGEEPITTHLNELESAFKELRYSVQDVFYVEDRVIQRWAGKGIFMGTFKDLKTTHKPFEYSGITMLRIKDSKITDIWIYNNLQEALEGTFN